MSITRAEAGIRQHEKPRETPEWMTKVLGSLPEGKVLTTNELKRIKASTPEHDLVRGEDIDRYYRLAQGQRGRRTLTDAIGLDWMLDGADDNRPPLDPELARETLQSEFPNKPVTLLLKEDGSPTGTENFVYYNADSFNEATEVYKIPKHQPEDIDDIEKRVLVNNFYWTLAPEHFRRLRIISTNDLHGFAMRKIEPHPDFNQAEMASKEGDPDPLRALIEKPFEDVYKLCEKYVLPFDPEPLQRNFTIDDHGNEVYHDEVRVPSTSIIAAMTQAGILEAMFNDPAIYSRRQELISIVRRLETLERKKRRKAFL